MSFARIQQQTKWKISTQYSIRKFSVVVNPVMQHNPSYLNQPVLPFGLSLTPKLRTELEKRNVNIDKVEQLYYHQLQDDYEFNAPAIPDRNSSLWGYIYGKRLVRSKVRLETLSPQEEYLRNYLTTETSELETRMKRYYPKLNWQAQYESRLKAVNEPVNQELENAYNKALADIIAESPETYIQSLKNNAFIDKYDENDKYKEQLPHAWDEKLTRWFEFTWDANDKKSNIGKYFGHFQQFEKSLSALSDLLSGPVRKGFEHFVIESFNSNQLSQLTNLVQTAQNSTQGVFKQSSDNPKELVENILSLLGSQSGKINKQHSHVFASLFFGDHHVAKQLYDKDVSDVVNNIASVDKNRLKLIHQCLEIKEYLKYQPISRVSINILLKYFPNWIGQFITDETNLKKFESENGAAFDNVISSLIKFHEAQETFSSRLLHFADTLSSNSSSSSSSGENTSKTGTEKILKKALNNISNLNKDKKEKNWITNMLKDFADEAKKNGDINGRINALMYSYYLENNSQNLPWYNLLTNVITPSRSGYSGHLLEQVALNLNSNASEASNALFDEFALHLKSTGAANSSGRDLSSKFGNEWNSLREAAVKYAQARQANQDAIKKIKFNFDGKFCFTDIEENYDPLNIYLSSYNYLNLEINFFFFFFFFM